MEQTINLTEKAAKEIERIKKEEQIKESGVRIGLLGGGCSGFQTDMFFDDPNEEKDYIFESRGIKIICDHMSFMYLVGTTIDYVTEGMIKSGFKFDSPLSKGSCGCGESMSF